MVVLPAAAATPAGKQATWLAIARAPILSQAHVAEVLLVVDTAVVSEAQWLATTDKQHATSVVDQTTMHATARRRR